MLIFRRENLNYLIVCFTQCTLFFQYVWFLLPICLLCLICAVYVTRICAVSWQIARQTFWSRRLACLRSHVLRAYCNFESKQAIFRRRPNNNNYIKVDMKSGWYIFHFKVEGNKFLLQKVIITCPVVAIKPYQTWSAAITTYSRSLQKNRCIENNYYNKSESRW